MDFAGGVAAWFFILFEVFNGEAGLVAANVIIVNKHVGTAVTIMRFIFILDGLSTHDGWRQ